MSGSGECTTAGGSDYVVYWFAGFIDDKARFPRRLITLCVDGVAILIGSLMGTSPLTVVAESSVGIKEGGRTGT